MLVLLRLKAGREHLHYFFVCRVLAIHFLGDRQVFRCLRLVHFAFKRFTHLDRPANLFVPLSLVRLMVLETSLVLRLGDALVELVKSPLWRAQGLEGRTLGSLLRGEFKSADSRRAIRSRWLRQSLFRWD